MGYLNTQGYKLNLAYNISDFAVAAVSWFDAWNLRDDLFGGQATGGAKLGNANSVQVLQVDFNLKF